jgi:uncharacterized protein (TIGR00255 family)
MTGYGAARARGPRIAVEAEARSVNARSLKVSLRIPPSLSAHETGLEELVRASLRRGTVTLNVRVEWIRPEDVVRIRTEVVEGAVRELQRLRKKGLVSGEVTPETIAHLPGAFDSRAEEPLGETEWEAVRKAVVSALAKLDGMRRREGARLAKELAAIGRRIAGALEAAAKRVPHVVREYQEKLRQRVDLLLSRSDVTLDAATLAREVALFADRSDVTEEIARLRAHLKEFDACLRREGEVGRTLDFVAQEMLREANTIGSKSADVEIAHRVVALKSEIDRLKEQVANLE